MTVPAFPKVYRIPVGKQGLIGRRIMSEEEVERLLSDPVVIEEKLDGKTVGTAIIEGYIVYGEFLKWKHSIYYDRLPSWIVAFDVLELKTGRFLNRREKEEFLSQYGIPVAPLICEAEIARKEDLIGFLDRRSEFSTRSKIEGVVVKNYRKQIMGKIVSHEFLTGMEKHWTEKKREMNRLDLSLPKPAEIAFTLECWEYA